MGAPPRLSVTIENYSEFSRKMHSGFYVLHHFRGDTYQEGRDAYEQGSKVIARLLEQYQRRD